MIPRLHRANTIGYAKPFSWARDAVIRVFDEAGNVIDTHERVGGFKELGRVHVCHLEQNKKPPRL